MQDTPDEIKKIQRDIINKKTTIERFALFVELVEFVTKAQEHHIRKNNIGISETALKIEMFKLRYSKDFSKEHLEEIIAQMRVR